MPLSSTDINVIRRVVLDGKAQTVQGQYFSRIRWTTTYSSPTYTITSNQLKKAFAYSQGADMSPGIGSTGQTAQASDTNLTTASQTVGGQSILIRGVGLQLLAWSDPVLAKMLDPLTSVALVMNGTQRTWLGIPSMLPGGSGWFGRMESQAVTPNPLEQIFFNCGAMTNGFPVIDNYFKFTEPVVWTPAGRGDSMLNVECNNYSAVTNASNYGGTDRTAIAESASFAGTNAYTHGGAGSSTSTGGAVFVDYMVILFGIPFQPESVN